ncbi:MAG: cob(I)yrinic acid a,c-diamide adenosyltransferase [Phycisphaerae bacterium]
MFEKGFVHIYTGDGKGKTTAAVGLALRASGQGCKVLIYQFLKPAPCSGEFEVIKNTKTSITIDALKVKWDLCKSLQNSEDTACAKKAIREALGNLIEIAQKGLYDLIILDELIFCLGKGLAEFEQVRNLIESKASHVELVLTGRGASGKIIDLADLVTEMRCIKHPFEKGVKARKGIEY